MYPLLLKPTIKDYIWGGTRLKKEFGFKTDKKIAAEAWELSCNKDGDSFVINGPLAEKTLREAIFGNWKGEGLGKKAEKFNDFPLLIKLIDAADRLSVQVHPDDDYALKHGGGFGKTEMWYVIDAEENSEILYGLKTNVSKEEFEQRIKNGTLLEICNYVPAKKGDVFFIPSGTLHAIGKGILIAEIQQNSNATYRVYDYDRIEKNGKPRELHINQAIDVTKRERPSIPYGNVGKLEKFSFGEVRELADCELFDVKLIELRGKIELCEKESFISLLILDGQATAAYDGGEIPLKKGNSLFVPAALPLTLSGDLTVIKTTL